MEEFIMGFDRAIKLEHSVLELPLIIFTILIEYLNTVLDQTFEEISDLNRAVRNCLLYLNLSNHEFCFQFATDCLKLYPKDVDFLVWKGIALNFLDRRNEGLVEFNHALKIDPNNFEILYHKAATLLYLIDERLEEKIETYEQFLTQCPKDHRKIPESYYAMSMIYFKNLDMVKANSCYEKGLDEEKNQLSFYLPYNSAWKKYLKENLGLSKVVSYLNKNKK